MKELEQGVIVLGGHVQSLGITRMAGRAGYSVIVIDNTKKNLARHSKYCKDFILVSDNNLLSELNSIKKKKAHKGFVLLPTNDFHVELLSVNKKNLQPYFRVGTGDWASVQTFYNKKKAYDLARSLGVPIAPTYYPSCESDLDNIRIKFPCIIKPAIMHSFHKQTKKKVFVCANQHELLVNYKLAQKYISKDEIIVQEIIQGPSKNQFSAAFLFLDGKAYVHIVACRMRQHPIDFGNATTYAETVNLPELKEFGEQILLASDYNGICEVEFKKDETDEQFKFLEVNTRTWKWHTIANKANTPFVTNYLKYLYGEKIEIVESYNSASFFHLVTDIPIRIQLLFKGFRYWNRVKSNCENAVWAIDDPLPYIIEKLYIPFLIINR